MEISDDTGGAAAEEEFVVLTNRMRLDKFYDARSVFAAQYKKLR